jgi:trehalose-6-phosphate synthase
VNDAIPWEQVVAVQREADVIFTSPLADGMNLVPLQAAAAQAPRPPESRAVIITGTGAGVAEVYGKSSDGLVTVDPLDGEEMTRTLLDAIEGRPARTSDNLIAAVRQNDARRWADRFRSDLEALP